MVSALCICSLLLSACLLARFYLLKKSLRKADQELKEIQKDLKQNHVLHLPLPDKDLEALMATVNDTLYEIRKERKAYAKREREFQSEIEAISHDLRTPLTVILGYLKLLQKHGETDPPGFTEEQCEMLDTTVRKAQAMEKLIAQFYDYSRLNANDYEMTFHEIDVNRILREAFVDNCLILGNTNLKARTCFPDHPVWVKGNRDALERIFENLLQNIGRYAKSCVKLGIEQKEDQVLVIFENDTDKLCEEDVPDLFRRFYRKEPSRSQGGSGLGLTIAKELAEKMGGSLDARVKSGERGHADGCITVCFTLCLPVLFDTPG